MTDERRSATIESLGDKELRDFYVSDHISEGVSFQIRAMREGRGWTQQEFGRLAGMAQERVSQLEDPDYGRLSLTTLKRVASAFDVALIVRFAPFSDLVDWAISINPDRLAVPSFDKDTALKPSLSSDERQLILLSSSVSSLTTYLPGQVSHELSSIIDLRTYAESRAFVAQEAQTQMIGGLSYA